jgi:hypothetical protein
MRPSNLNDISARVARGTLFITAVSMLSLHAMAQSSEIQKPLPSPIFAATPSVEAAPLAVPSTTKVDRITPTAAAAPGSAPSGSTPGNRMSGFTVPADAADTLSKSPVTSAAKPAAIAQAPAAPGATSRAGIPRLNKTKQPNNTPQHPLADSYPGYEVVVCIAGCGEAKAVSIYKPRQQQEYAQSQVGMQGGFIQVSMTSETNATECLAGCYDDRPARPRSATPVNSSAAVATPSSPVGATDRSVMVQTSTGMPAGAMPAKQKPKAAKKTGSEWFTRRFDRKQTNTN